MNLAEGRPDPGPPGFVQIEPVRRCRPPAFMTFDTFMRTIAQIPATNELHLQGPGEPLLHPRFFDMVSYAAARGIAVCAHTSMPAMSGRRAEECVKSGLRRMHVLIDAADDAAYECVRTGAKYSHLVRNLDRVLEAKRALRSRFPEVHLVAVRMRPNPEELPALVRFAGRRSLQGVAVEALCEEFAEASFGGRLERCFAEARAIAGEHGIQLRLPRTG